MDSPKTIGEELKGFRRTVTQDRVTAYAHASGDHNPIHLDEEFREHHSLRTTDRSRYAEPRVCVGDDVSQLPCELA